MPGLLNHAQAVVEDTVGPLEVTCRQEQAERALPVADIADRVDVRRSQHTAVLSLGSTTQVKARADDLERWIVLAVRS